MPNCFSLTRKSTGQITKLQDIDKELCQYFEVPCHPQFWLESWYDIIGFKLAMGKTFDEIIEQIKSLPLDSKEDDILLKIAEYLKEHYTSDCWAEIGRR